MLLIRTAVNRSCLGEAAPPAEGLTSSGVPRLDTEILKTFPEVNRTWHWERAAQNLYMIQAAVRARIRLLADVVGRKLRPPARAYRAARARIR